MKRYSIPYFMWMLVFIVLPLILIVMLAFSDGMTTDGLEFSFSIENIKRVFDPVYLRIIFNSLVLAAVSTVICIIIGYPVAYIIANSNKKYRNTLILLFVIPMWMNFLLRTYAWLSLLGSNGILNLFFGKLGLGPFDLLYNNKAILLGMVYNFLPFMVLPIYSVLIKIDKSLIEAARDLGATTPTILRKVVVPLSLGGVVTGITMVFVPAVSTFIISNLLGGNNFMLIGNVVEQQFRFTGDWNFGSAISLVLMVIILITMSITSRVDSSGKQGGKGLW
ncbi:MAG: ABC transporter permease [Tissierellia bacterium]|nr:ABC transporter permease [Tissierellia bacterium]